MTNEQIDRMVDSLMQNAQKHIELGREAVEKRESSLYIIQTTTVAMCTVLAEAFLAAREA